MENKHASDPRDSVIDAIRNVAEFYAHDCHCSYHHTEVCDCGQTAARKQLTDALDQWSAQFDLIKRKLKLHAERDARVLKALEAAQDRLNVAIEEHPCWAGGFSATEGVVPNWCERCFPIHVTALQVRAAIAELKGE